MIQTLQPVTGLALGLAAGRSLWLPVLAMLAVAGLLLAFQLVVSQASQQGAARHRATAAAADANWRCNAPGPARQRAACRAAQVAAH